MGESQKVKVSEKRHQGKSNELPLENLGTEGTPNLTSVSENISMKSLENGQVIVCEVGSPGHLLTCSGCTLKVTSHWLRGGPVHH